MGNRPNILFVFADQLRYDSLACNGNTDVRTPNLDRFASEGCCFDQAFSGHPVCSPYRAQLLTGNYSHVNGVMCNQYRLRDNQVTLAQELGACGYRTAYFGKWHLGFGPYPKRKRAGFDDLFAYNCTHHYFNVKYHHNEEGPFAIEEYAPDGETRLLLNYLDDHRKNSPNKPFCAMLSWGPPHWSSCTGIGREYGIYPRRFDIYDTEQITLPQNIPHPMRAYARREFADYYAMVTSLDECFGRILAALEEWNLADDTIVCFSSDHGDKIGAHGYGKPIWTWLPPNMREGKGTPYEESIHIPLLLRYPQRIGKGRRSGTFVNTVDVMPTLLGLCGLAPSQKVQGQDLSHAALGTPGPEPDSVFFQNMGTLWPNRPEFIGFWRAVRTRQYTYARWHDQGGKRMLFDRQADPWEMTNQINNPACAAVAGEMEQRLQAWLKRTGDPFDTGRRLPVTQMLDIGQQFANQRDYDTCPPAYREAIEKYMPTEF